MERKTKEQLAKDYIAKATLPGASFGVKSLLNEGFIAGYETAGQEMAFFAEWAAINLYSYNWEDRYWRKFNTSECLTTQQLIDKYKEENP